MIDYTCFFVAHKAVEECFDTVTLRKFRKCARFYLFLVQSFPAAGRLTFIAACQALFYLFTLETDLRKHTLIEEQILVPVAGRMEELSAREKEILIAVAQGKLNKEIADQYNISIHTVITHRKNITRKTGIKTVAGLTVYALLNNLIDMNTVE